MVVVCSLLSYCPTVFVSKHVVFRFVGVLLQADAADEGLAMSADLVQRLRVLERRAWRAIWSTIIFHQKITGITG